jgi:hypothetical protein
MTFSPILAFRGPIGQAVGESKLVALTPSVFFILFREKIGNKESA